jgi:hypothetical protein
MVIDGPDGIWDFIAIFGSIAIASGFLFTMLYLYKKLGKRRKEQYRNASK